MVQSFHEKYNEEFGIEPEQLDKLREAFKQVSEIRKFEIELYWKHSGYFWAFVTVAYTGYFAVIGSEHLPYKYFLSFMVGLIGFTFTSAWHLANRGSKYWQENWENHLDMLEDKVTGPLYKTLLERPAKEKFITDRFITGPMALSVSKLNQWISVFILLTWTPLMSICVYEMRLTLGSSLYDKWFIPICSFGMFVGAVFICAMMQKAKTYKGRHDHHMVRRPTQISDK